MKETNETTYLPNRYTPNPLMPETDFRILEWVLQKTYPVMAPRFFATPTELVGWQRGPPSWPFCGSVALLICRIYPSTLLAYDQKNNHGFNLIPTDKDPAEIDLTRDQFTSYTPIIEYISDPLNDNFLTCIFTDILTDTFHRQVRQIIGSHPNILSASDALKTWVRGE